MENFDVSALRKLSSFRRNTKIGRVRVILSEIEELIAGGVPYEKIIEELNAQGIEISMSHFKNMIHRLRKQRDRENKSSVVGREVDPVTMVPANGAEVTQYVDVGGIVSASVSAKGATTKSIRAIFRSEVDLSKLI